MSNNEKIAVAEQRILELETLIKHWKSSEVSSRKATAEIVEALISERLERRVA